MAKLILLVGESVAFAVGLAVALGGIGTSDQNGRVPMPGKKVLTLSAGDFDAYYELRVKTEGDEIFEPPEGARVKVEGGNRPAITLGEPLGA